jgi:Protein of unknown function (DUF4232)
MIVSTFRTGPPACTGSPASTGARTRTGAGILTGAPGFRRRLVLVLVLGATVVLSTACSSSRNSAAPVVSAPPAASTAAVPASPSDTAAPVTSSTSRAVPPASATPAPSRPVSSAPTRPAPVTASPAGGCATGELTVVALRGSGAAGHQYAFLQFTNRSARTCTLTGFPGVQLLRGGALLGKPATRSTKPVATVRLAPGHSATARLVDDSTCNAEKSDSVQIYPPNRTEKVVVPLSVRGCALTIDPVLAG